MDWFILNGRLWHVRFVDPMDPILVDRTGRLTVATTDPNTNMVNIAANVTGSFLARVLIHEIGHCALESFNLKEIIHSVVYPDRWIEAEEWICNFIADYGMLIFKATYEVIGDEAMKIVPFEIERFLA